MIYRKPSGVYAIDFSDRRVGRVALSARTRKKAEATRRESALRALLDAGEVDLVRATGKKDGPHIADVQAAVESGDVGRLRAAADINHDLGRAIDRLMQDVKGGRETGTWEVYRWLFADMERHFGVVREGGRVVQDVPMAAVTSDMLRAWMREPKATNRNQPWSRRRQKLARALVGRLWKTELHRSAELADLANLPPALTRNPVAGVEAPKIRQTRVVFLSPLEWRTLSRITEGQPIRALLGLWCLAGLRQQEGAHLRTDIDVVLDGPAPHIKVQPRDGEYPWRPKTDRSIRDVPVCAELLSILQDHVRLGFSGERYFTHPIAGDRPYGAQRLMTMAREAFEAAGIKYGSEGDALTIHSLRHTFASWLAQRDVQLLKIAALLGDRVEQVAAVYAHLCPSDLDRAVAVIDDVLEVEA